MTIAYICNPSSGHEAKWISCFAQQYKVLLICSVNAPEVHLSLAEVPVFRILPKTFPFINLVSKWKAKQKLRQLIKQQKIDILHAMYAVPNAYYPHLIGFKKFIITTRGSDVLVDYQQYAAGGRGITFVRNWYLKQLTEKSFKAASYTTSTSLRQQEVVRQMVNSENKLKLIRTGVNAELFSQPHSYSGVLNQQVRLFSPRNMLPLYNVLLLVEALAELKSHFPAIQLVLLDNRPNSSYTIRVKQLITTLKLESNIEWLPTLDAPGMANAYSQADITVMVPASDGTPNSAIESMLMKRPVVLPNLPYDADLFNDATVWKVAGYTATEIADTLKEVLQLPTAARKAKVDAAYELALAKCSLSAQLTKVDQLYQNIYTT